MASPETSSLYPEMCDGLNEIKRAELIAHVADLDRMIEDQMAHLKFVIEKGWDIPAIDVHLERLKESRRRCLSALKPLLADAGGDDQPGTSRR